MKITGRNNISNFWPRINSVKLSLLKSEKFRRPLNKLGGYFTIEDWIETTLMLYNHQNIIQYFSWHPEFRQYCSVTSGRRIPQESVSNWWPISITIPEKTVLFFNERPAFFNIFMTEKSPTSNLGPKRYFRFSASVVIVLLPSYWAACDDLIFVALLSRLQLSVAHQDVSIGEGWLVENSFRYVLAAEQTASVTKLKTDIVWFDVWSRVNYFIRITV